MRITTRFLCLLVLSFGIFFPLAARAASDLTDEMITADKRLTEAKVTVQSSHIYVGELLELWSRQTGIDLSAGTKDGAADEPLVVYVKDVPLKSAMRSLWSLFSYRPGSWTWEREGDAKTGFRYVLHQPFAARQLGANVKEGIQKDYEAEVAALLAGLTQTPEERKKLVASDPSMAQMLNDPIRQNGLAAFAETLKGDDRQKVLHSKNEREGITKNVSDLGEAGRKFVGDFIQSQRRLNPGTLFTDPTKVGFFSDAQTMSVPALFVTIGDGRSMDGFNYAGGPRLAAKIRPNLLNLWIMPPDHRSDPQEAALVVRPPKSNDAAPPKQPNEERNTKRDKTAQLVLGLRQLSESTNTPLMARVPEMRGGRDIPLMNPPYDQPISGFLHEIEQWDMQHKWREKTLLITALTRLTDVPDAEREPWALVKMLRDDYAASPDGTFSTEQIALIAASFSKQQIDNACKDEFPSVNYSFQATYELFRRIGQRPALLPELRSPAGCADSALLAYAANLLFLDTLKGADKAVALRIIEEKKMLKTQENGQRVEVPILAVTVQALSAQNKVVQSLMLPQRIVQTPPAITKNGGN